MNLTTLLNRLMRYIARRGLRDAAKLIPSENTMLDQPQAPVHLDPEHLQLHLFSANFPSQAEADAFCTAPRGTDQPSRLTQELDGAFIDEAEVEVVHGDIQSRLLEFLSGDEVDDVLLRLAGDDTLIIITENAFHDLPYTLDDTAHLTYLGHIVVPV
ncbi:hypothetical protein ACOI1H_12525 [Loktanella sp. DJP18]|uniref:hypothetical protein n=1 Tax=Loktanella sp. DJP18 TaxID=3409788 RepID=UPI003BB7AFB0